MKFTEKLGLKKPELTDYVNVNDLNDNMDVLDEEVGNLKEGSTTIEELQTSNKTLAGAINELSNKKVDKVTGKGLSTNDYTDEEKQKNQDNADNISNLQQELETHKADYTTFKDSKGEPNGLAGLDSYGNLPLDLIPTIVPSEDIITQSALSVVKNIPSENTIVPAMKITVNQGGKYRIKGEVKMNSYAGNLESLRVYFHIGELKNVDTNTLGFILGFVQINSSDTLYKNFTVDLDSVPANATITVSLTKTGKGDMTLRNLKVCGMYGDIQNEIVTI